MYSCTKVCFVHDWVQHARTCVTVAAVQAACKLFSQIQRVIHSKQLGPTVRTQYMRTAFQVSAPRCLCSLWREMQQPANCLGLLRSSLK